MNTKPVLPIELAQHIPLGPEHASWLASIRKEVIKRTLIQTRGNQTQAAKLLGIHRNTLRTALEYPTKEK